jgi:hypothetical protein
MEKYYWNPTREDRIGVCMGIFMEDGLTRGQVEEIVDAFPGQSIDFFGALRARVYDDKASVGGEVCLCVCGGARGGPLRQQWVWGRAWNGGSLRRQRFLGRQRNSLPRPSSGLRILCSVHCPDRALLNDNHTHPHSHTPSPLHPSQQVREFVESIGHENLNKRLVNSKEGKVVFEKPKMGIEILMAYGKALVGEQDNVKRVQLADAYLGGAELAGSTGSSVPEQYEGE